MRDITEQDLEAISKVSMYFTLCTFATFATGVIAVFLK